MPAKKSVLASALLLFLIVGACAEPTNTQDMEAMRTDEPTTQVYAPAVSGYYDGHEIVFIHTEASDAGVAEMLTEMMGPEVLPVPQLADVPADLLANVYVFTNGIEGMGPFGFQPDVFDSVPGDAEYSPLRAVYLVSWNDGVNARHLKSVAAILQAEAEGELTIKHTGYVVNMPILAWPGGHR